MTQGQTNQSEVGQPERDQDSLALYAWAGIAAVSALAACVTMLFPTERSVQLAKKPGLSTDERIVVARRPDIVVPEDEPKPSLVVAKLDRNLDRETTKLLEKYGETTEPVDELTTATAEGDVEDVSVEPLEPAQPFPADNAMGATIGLSDSIPALAERYAALQRRAPDLFETVEPLVELVEGDNRLEARLVAGPFSQEAEMAEFCRAIKLRITIDCSAGDYTGEPLAQ